MEKTIRMPKELLEKWLAALRSGEYKQGREALRSRDGGYCCLGVLVACSGDNPPLDRAYPSRGWLDGCGVCFFDMDGNRRDNQPWLPKLSDLAGDANDAGRTFAEIADAIEACAEGI